MRFLSTRQPRFARFVGTLRYGARGVASIVIGVAGPVRAIGWGNRALGFDSALNMIAHAAGRFPRSRSA